MSLQRFRCEAPRTWASAFNATLGGDEEDEPPGVFDGLLVDRPHLEIVTAYSRDHDRKIGAGTFTAKLGSGKIVYQRVPGMHPVLQRRFLGNALQ